MRRALAVAQQLRALGVPKDRIVAEAASDDEPIYQTSTARGIAANRLDASGKGESSPVASNSDATGRQMNRRVEVVIANPVVSAK